MRSQRIGQGFESPRLHHHKQTASQERCRLLMVAKPAGERTCARHYIKQRVSLPSHFGSQCVHFIRARRFGGLRSETLSPAPSPERNDRLANLYPPSDICPYGEAPLVTTCRDTAKSVSFGFLRSRQGSELARDIISSNAFLYLPILAATACTSSVRAGSAAAAADAFARAVARAERPACKSISPVRHLPLWRSSPRHDLPRHRKVGVLRIFA